MKQTRSTRNYEVGHGKPPKATRFRKGRSGNPRGRTRGSENIIAVFKRLANKRVKVTEHGIVRTMSMAEAIIAQNVKAALNKDPIAMGNIFRLATQAREFEDLTDPKVVGLPIFMPGRMGVEEFIAYYGLETIHVPSTRTSGQSNP